VISGRFEARKPVFVKRDRDLYDWSLEREICKPVLKLDFTTHDIMESLPEFVPMELHELYSTDRSREDRQKFLSALLLTSTLYL
jgi:hypothetical protein